MTPEILSTLLPEDKARLAAEFCHLPDLAGLLLDPQRALHAMFRAEEAISGPQAWKCYRRELTRLCAAAGDGRSGDPVHADAPHRLDAFLLTVYGDPAAAPEVPVSSLTDEEMARVFEEQARLWRQATRGFSIVAQRYRHPAYQTILSLGRRAVPLVLAELQRHPDRWFHALRTMSGMDDSEDPARHASDFADAIGCWLAWGRERGLLAA